MTWVVSAFEPFQGAKTNSSWICWENLRQIFKDDSRFHFVGPVPVTFDGAWPYLLDRLNHHLKSGRTVNGVLALGQAESRTKIGLERVALNWIDSSVVDNSGVLRAHRPVGEGPEVLWSGIPWEKFKQARCERSYSAGTFVCNLLMFELLKWCRANGIEGGFVHVPALLSQVEDRFLKLPRQPDKEIVEALCEVLEFAASAKDLSKIEAKR